MRNLVRFASLALLSAAPLVLAQSLDYQVYRTRVEPIFLKKRPGHARCVVCHSTGGGAFRLQPLSPGAKTWTEEQSRKNFEAVSKLIIPSNVLASPILKHPLAGEAGGDDFHSGGRQFASQNDPDWKAMADWARAAK